MGWLDKLFGRNEDDTKQKISTASADPSGTSSSSPPFAGLESITFGRYSDNNKSQKKTLSWYRSEDRFKERNYTESFAAVFDYLRDEDEDNVRFQANGRSFTFEVIQGSKKIKGECDGSVVVARVPLAHMESPTTAVMRRLLDINYNLFYSRSAMDEQNTLYMVFDSDVPSASPNKIYYALREMATKADRLDDMLLEDFGTLKPAGTDHIQKLSDRELDVKYKYFRYWITDTLNRVSELNQDSFSGAIAYLLLTLIYRIEFLITPQGKLMNTMEKINGLYWNKKDEIALVERNQMMKDAVRKLLDISKEEFAESIYRTKASFAITAPPHWDKLREYIVSANKDSRWYTDNKYPDLAIIINEYGMVYNQFVHSMPKVMTDLTTIYMAVMHQEYFTELGMTSKLYDSAKQYFNKVAIEKAVEESLKKFKDKYLDMKWQHERIRYDSLYDFGISFSEQMANMNMDTRRT